jgi:hypothetical protein
LPVADIIFHGEPPLPRRITITLAAVAALLSCAGCIVTTSTYDAKVRETEALRDAYASSNREKSRLAGEVEALSKRLDACEAGRTREKME